VIAQRGKSQTPKLKEKPLSIPEPFCNSGEAEQATIAYEKSDIIFLQGEPADAVFYIQKGKVKLSVFSRHGKEAVIGIMGPGDFFGEACLAGQQVRTSAAAAMTYCSIVRLDKNSVAELLAQEGAFSGLFLSYLLARNIRMEEDLVDQLFNSSEKRLARALLMLANFGKEDQAEPSPIRITQETLAEMIGATRPRVSFFMNRFRKLGFIHYDDHGLRVNSSLLAVVLRD